VSLSPARAAALAVVARVRKRKAYAHETLHAVLRSSGVTPRDRAFATRLAYGTIAAVGVLDEALVKHLDAPGQLEPGVRDALRIAAYEILFMRTPVHAAVDQGVEAVRSVKPRATGLANAVLRRLAEEAGSFPWGDPKQDVSALARSTGHPVWIAEMLVQEHGWDAAGSIMCANQEGAPLFLWVNQFATDPSRDVLQVLEEDGADAVPYAHAGCLHARDAAAAISGVGVRDGLVLVTDAASQVAALACDPGPGDLVVDLAAGRGTKTIGLQACAIRNGGEAEVWAVDIHHHKIREIKKRAELWQVPRIRTVTADALNMKALVEAGVPAQADVVLVDVPCSGLGSLRRHPDKTWQLSAEDIPRLAILQRSLLAAAARLVRPGGAIVYATCTISVRENENIVRGFLDSSPGRDFTSEGLEGRLPDFWQKDVGPEGWFRTVPSLGGPDGHFVARLVRNQG